PERSADDVRGSRPVLARGGPPGAVRLLRPRRRPEHLAPAPTRTLPRRQARAVPRPGGVGLRLRPGGLGPVLLSTGREGLHRPQLLRRAAPPLRRPWRVRPGLRPGA